MCLVLNHPKYSSNDDPKGESCGSGWNQPALHFNHCVRVPRRCIYACTWRRSMPLPILLLGVYSLIVTPLNVFPSAIIPGGVQ